MGFAFIEYFDIPTAAYTLSLFYNTNNSIFIDNKYVEVSYGHVNSFIPVYEITDMVAVDPVSGMGVYLSYWDMNCFVASWPVVVSTEIVSPNTNTVTTTMNATVTAEPVVDNAAKAELEKKKLEEEMRAFYKDVEIEPEPEIDTKPTSTEPSTKQTKPKSKPTTKLTAQLQKWNTLSTQLTAPTEQTQLPSDAEITTQNEDLELKACILCQRGFKSIQDLRKHQELSDLHRSNLVEWKRNKLEELGSYRDRAGERRDVTVIEEPFERKGDTAVSFRVKKPRLATVNNNEPPAVNKGLEMLRKMGWKEGQGLGKSGEGITAPVEASSYGSGAVGLGSVTAANVKVFEENDTYQERVKKIARARYDGLL